MLSHFLARLPERFQWPLHNLVAHPAMEILFQLGFTELSELVHDATTPYRIPLRQEEEGIR